MSTIDVDVLHKRPSESYRYNMDFSAKLDDDDSIATVTSWVSAPEGLVVGTLASSGKLAQARLSGGLDGVKYLQTVIAVTAAGNTVQMEGYLFVRDVVYS